MNPLRPSRALFALLTIALFVLPIAAQDQQRSERCQPPRASVAGAGASIFTPQQEMDLGDAIAEHAQRNFRVIDDEEVVGYLRRIGERLVSHLPPSEMRYQFFLVDLPTVNAFALPGGRIYVARKLVAFARTEDELAGVLAHELGHIASRQTAEDMSRRFRDVLGVQQVTDRKDIFEKYNQLVENIARKREAFRQSHKHTEREQLEADQIGIYAMANAGYDPQAFAIFWDRLAETKGKTGGWFSDLFGTTKPEARRLREMLKHVSALPAECTSTRRTVAAAEFQKWQTVVLNYSGLGRKEALHAVISKKALDPPLRGDINHIRFSPDGKYLLAQDDSGINLLSREPFAFLFRIDAPEARQAQFTPDSQQVVFHTPGLRVEFWDIADEQLKTVHELYTRRKRCIQTALAPDGKTLVCFDSGMNLALFDTASGEQVFEKKEFYTPGYQDLFWLLYTLVRDEDDTDELEFLHMGFSPDARYFAAGRFDSAIAIDLSTRTTVSLGGSLKKFIGTEFAFAAPDKVIGIDRDDPQKKSAVVSFPSGQTLEQLPLGRTYLSTATRGDYLLLRPIKDFPVGVMNMTTKKIFMAHKQSAIDLYDDYFVRELNNGEVGLFKIGEREVQSNVVLPRSPLGRLRAAVVSPDLKWLAVSERSRGAVWDLTKGERLFHVRGFRGAYFGDDGAVYADFPKFEQTERSIAKLDLKTREASSSAQLEEGRITQHGAFVVLTKPARKDGDLRQNVTTEVRDARSNALLWSKNFTKEAPGIWVDPVEATMVLSWSVSADAAKAEIKSNPALGQQLATMKEKEGDLFLQALDARTGKPLGALLIETGKGSFRISDITVAGDWVVISDTQNRVLVYSLSTGEQKGKTFGNHPTVAKASGLLGVENERGQLTIYDLASMQRRDQFTFSSPISLAQFSPDGKRLFVLTANQTTYLLDLSKLAASL